MQNIAEKINKSTIVVNDLMQFDVDAIMHSGQVFRYTQTQHGYNLIVGKHSANIEKQSEKVIITINTTNSADFFYNYFDLDTDYNKIKTELQNFKSLQDAIKAGSGIRILKAEFVETIISFIISANNNIKRFTKTLNALAQNFGDKLACGGFAFPTLLQLSTITQSDFAALGCGYRSAYLVKAIEQLQTMQSLNVDNLKLLSNSDLQKTLMQLQGVGAKVAACIMLFCGDFNRLNTVPIDTWILKALEQLSAEKEKILTHKYAGIAQQYIFYYMQHLRKDLI